MKGGAPAALAVHPGVLTGIALAAGGYALFALQDAAVKWLVATYPVAEILCLRSAVIVGLALLSGGGPRASAAQVLASRNKPALAARAALILAAWTLFYSASAHMGLAEITTLYFAAPVIAVALSALFLKERVGPARLAAVALGLAGVVIAAGPMGAVPAGPAAAALLAAACWGVSTVLVRWIGRTDATPVQMLASNGLFVAASAPALFWLWRTPDPPALALMLGLGVTGGLGQYLLFEGFRFAPASALAPVEYTGLVWAGVYGYAIWTDVPGAGTAAGAGLILAGSAVLVWSETRRRGAG